MEEINLYLDDAKDSMQKAIKHTELELSKIRAGKASPNMFDALMVEYYGTSTPLAQVATVSVPEPRSITIKAYEKSMVTTIEKAIRDSNMGFNPQNDGDVIRINIPPLTEERRRDLVKQTKAEGESGKVRIRKIRQETNEELRKLLKDGASEDEVKKAEEVVQALTNDTSTKLEALIAAKEKELMTV